MSTDELIRRSHVREAIGWAACAAGVLTACGMATRDWSLALAPALLSALSMVFAGSERGWRRELRGEENGK